MIFNHNSNIKIGVNSNLCYGGCDKFVVCFRDCSKMCEMTEIRGDMVLRPALGGLCVRLDLGLTLLLTRM